MALSRPTQVVDLFCGVGGLTRGLLDAGLNVIAGVDLDLNCRYAYETNNAPSRFIHADVNLLQADSLRSLYAEHAVKILVGCAPCQPFSKYTKKSSKTADAQWALVSSFRKLIQQIKPDVVSMENVPELIHHVVFSQFVRSLKRLNYEVSFRVMNCADYGMPQERERLVLLASRLGPITLPEPNPTVPKKTVRDAIGHLETIRAGGVAKNDGLHRSCKLSELNAARIRRSKPGGTWRDWPVELRAACHTRKSGQTYPSVYGRMQWDKPSPTITTQYFGYGNGRFGHPQQHRAISIREGALLQTFPESYQFVQNPEDMKYATLGRLIGNAVPVDLGKVIGNTIQAHLTQEQPLSR